jgi:hypothetical protein
MALVIKDRVKQTTTTTGTGTLTLNGTVDGFQTFAAALSDGDTTYYSILEPSTNNWEVGLGTWTEGSSLLARTTVLASSNSGSAVNLTAQAEVFISQPAGKAAFFNANGDLELNQDPTSALHAATKEYVDTIAAAGLHYHDPVRVEQEGNLSATYDNGTAGVGATLTNNSTQAALVIDGVTLSTNDRVLIYEQTDATQNGVYTVTDTGSASTNWVLTRSTDTDSYAPSDPNSFGKGDAFFVLEGNAGAGELYVMNTEGTITFGTTNITFTQVASTAVYSAGNGLTLTGTVFAADAGTGVTVDGTGINIGQAVETTSDVTFNSVTASLSGNVTGNVTGDVTGNADTATALETARNIGGVSFDGTASINLPGVNTTGNQDTTGNAATATAWATGRTISLTGDVTGSVTGVDGSGNATIATTIAANSVALGTDTTGNYVATVTSGNYLTGGTSGEGSTPTLNVDATPTNTASKVVARDASGNFSAGTITANLTGTASNAATLDSLDSTQFLRSDANDSTSGKITSTTSSGDFLEYNGGAANPYFRFKTSGVNNGYIQFGSDGASYFWNDRQGEGFRIDGSGPAYYNGSGYQTIWHAGNDGSGSGLDADTVDGIQASSFLRSDADDSMSGQLLINNSSANPLELQRSSQVGIEFNDTSTGSRYLGVTSGNLRYGSNLDHSTNSLVWTSGNDGSGSGLDADTLDGQHGSYYHPTNTTILQQGGDITNQNWNNYFDGTEASWNTVINHSGSNRPSSAYTYGTALSFGKASAGRFQLYAPHNGSEGQSLWYRTGWNTDYDAWAKIWDSSNDGSGSGLDADTTDGYQASESITGSTLAARNSSGDLYMRYGISTYLNMSHSSTTRNSDTVFYSSTDSYLRKNNATGFKNSLGLGTGDSPTFNNAYLAGSLYRSGDTDTGILFGTNTITLQAGGSSEITVNTTGVRLGDTGNGYFQPVSGNYGSIQIDGGAHGSHEGYSIGGRAVFMHDNASRMGLYDDVNNEWGFLYDFNSAAQIFYNGLSKLQTTSSGVNINGDLNAVDNIYLASSLIHEGDTDTYVGFANNAINLYTGGSLTQVTASGVFISDGSLREDYDALSGTTPTCDVSSAGAFSLTMTGNTTFTFSNAVNNYSNGFVLQLTGNGSTVTWPTSVDWAGGTAPDAPASGETDIYVFWTRDGGTTWYGVLSVDAAA